MQDELTQSRGVGRRHSDLFGARLISFEFVAARSPPMSQAQTLPVGTPVSANGEVMPNRKSLPMPNTSVRDWVSLPGPTAMQLILHRVDSAPNSRAVAAAVINIAHFSAMRDEGQRARVRRLGTSRSFTVQIGSVGTDLEEALSSIVEDAEDPAFV